MREDDDKYELKKALTELNKSKGKRNQVLKETIKEIKEGRNQL